MAHAELIPLDIDRLVDSEPIKTSESLTRLMAFCVCVGIVTMIYGLAFGDPSHVWGAYYINLIYFLGLAVGSCMIPVIFQIVRALWSPPIRRIAEANIAFLPWAYILFLTTYLGREHIFPWARAPMPGREWWMQPNFVYLRFALLLALLFFMMFRFVRISLRGDIGLLQERSKNKERWHGFLYDSIAADWQGSEQEVGKLQAKLSWNAPLLVFSYAIIISLFAFEMIMSLDTIWYSNMFGGFIFIGNIYLAWAILTMVVYFMTRVNKDYADVVRGQQYWDLGKLMLGFGILWAYLFFSQFLPQWYGNLPEETQWMILRTREYPWKGLGWFTLAMSFVIPFIMLISRDVKKTPAILSSVSVIIAIGVWCEKYMIVMPQLSPNVIPFGVIELGLFLGFLGIYVISITSFLKKYPFAPISSPLARGSTDW